MPCSNILASLRNCARDTFPYLLEIYLAMKLKQKFISLFKILFISGFFLFLSFFAYRAVTQYINENKILKQIVSRLEADSRIAEVIVTDFRIDELTGKLLTTIKFLEYDTKGRPLKAKYFTFEGNIIQFQSLIVRFDDIYVRNADPLKGKSAYLFWKAFILEGENTQEYEIARVNEVPEGYKIEGTTIVFEQKFWKEFWRYALDEKVAQTRGIKNAQIEAPGSKFVPGILYTLKIEHDGGIRIDTTEIPGILKGERILDRAI